MFNRPISCKVVVAVLMLKCVLTASAASAKSEAAFVSTESKGCREGVGEMHKSFGQVVLDIRPSPDSEEPCEVTLADATGRVFYSSNDYAVGLHIVTGEDVNGDGAPDVVIENFSGGAHCCDRYDIISLSTVPIQVATVKSNHPIAFKKFGDRIIFCTEEGSFDYFETDYADHPYADVFLRLDGKQLLDVSSQFVTEYDKRIAEAQARLPKEALEKFQSTGEDPKEGAVKGNVLTIVLEYLYSGREQRAWESLSQMWPVSDQERVKHLILEARTKGVLSQLGRYPL